MLGVLYLDVEAGRDGRIREVGAVRGDQCLHWRMRSSGGLADELSRLAAGAQFIGGHNILAHDLPLLQALLPQHPAWSLPVIDTLTLSPLAFPRNPYHALVKDYKLVRDAINDPVADARLSERLLLDELAAFRAMPPELAGFFAWCLGTGLLPAGLNRSAEGTGMRDIMLRNGARPPQGREQLWTWLKTQTSSLVCRSAFNTLGPWLSSAEKRPALAYLVAWMRGTPGNSVIPGWVRRSIPGATDLLRLLRDTPCQARDCEWCRQQHDPEPLLQRSFGFPEYRREPISASGGSLQREVVAAGLAGQPLLAILPTGGGKSLCFQIPALARHSRTGALTVVISPLQALMRDQVENLERKTGCTAAAAIYGMLSLPERAAILERVRLGSVGLLYVSPEQLRNRSTVNAILARQVGCWVFDEAHCLSKWGHDFRPDYLYALRFIGEKAPAPVTCVTATAKHEVIQEIQTLVKERLGQDLSLLSGGVERSNLTYSVHEVTEADKEEMLLDLLARHLGDDNAACAVVYCRSRGRTRDYAERLHRAGLAADFFHAGRSAQEKGHVLDGFVRGDIKVVCATNAFGMGIDKDSVRLVVHVDMPGSLENYLQEAGRAGRDGLPAHCAILYDRDDADAQFRLSALSELSHKDIVQILRAVRQSARRLGADEVVVTTGELLAEEVPGEAPSTLSADGLGDTRVKTAIAWLERAELLSREENDTSVRPGRPKVASLTEARERIGKLDLPQPKARRWTAVLGRLISAAGDQEDEQSLSVDELSTIDCIKEGARSPQERSARVREVLDGLENAGLVDAASPLSALVKPREVRGTFDTLAAAERGVVDLLREAAPDAEDGDPIEVSLRALTQRLHDLGHGTIDPSTARRLLHSLEHGERLGNRSVERLTIRALSREHFRLHVFGGWDVIAEEVGRRQSVSRLILDGLIEKTRKDGGRAAQAVVRFTIEELSHAIRQNMFLAAEVEDASAAVQGALVALHDLKMITLQQGLAIFRQAMTLKLSESALRRGFTNGDYAPLQQHYQGRIFQIHVMEEFIRLGLRDSALALRFAGDYFSLPAGRFAERYLAGRNEDFRRPLSPEAYAQIVTDLKDKAQQDIVTAGAEKSLLVLAGPGAGKTRVIVHRAAWLVCGLRLPARSILVLCFNRSAAQAVRRRLRDLLGDEARQIDVFTYHGLAMRLIGASFSDAVSRKEDGVDELLQQVVRDATQLLTGQKALPGLDPEEVRDQLLSRYRTILIDEYQDIDDDQYALISAVAGRTLEDEARITLMAVGDDDQSLYGFRGANVGFIRRFEEDYGAKRCYLTENYRSTKAIIAAANALIAHNQDRMKTGHPIQVNKARRADPEGGAWDRHDPILRGRVQCLRTADTARQCQAVLAELRRLQSLDPTVTPDDVAVLAPTHRDLIPMRALCDARGIPTTMAASARNRPFPLSRLREVQALLGAVTVAPRLTPDDWNHTLAQLRGRFADSPWWPLVEDIAGDLNDAMPKGGLSRPQLREIIFDALAQMRAERTASRGLILSTLHGAKGLEFPHVFILDGQWHDGASEESRRTFYVGMTRAIETLTLYCRADAFHPHIGLVAGQCVERSFSAAPPPENLSLTPELIGLDDLYLSHLGNQPPSALGHQALARLAPGAPIRLVFQPEAGKRARIETVDGICIGLMTSPATERLRQRAIAKATLAAVVSWTAEASEPAYRDRLRLAQWEVPVVEIWWHNPPQIGRRSANDRFPRPAITD